ncbi:TPA: flavodoxin FldB [Providencia rettgeri]
MKIGLFYGSSTCYTEMVAEKIRDILGDDFVTLNNVNETPPSEMEQYDILILGIPTWDFGEIQEDWLEIWDALPNLNLTGKIVAMYGLGDQIDYSEWFLDALGLLYHQLKPTGVQFIGFWPTEGYTFDSPKPLNETGDMFVGLALDEVHQFEQTDERIAQWCVQILQEIEASL